MFNREHHRQLSEKEIDLLTLELSFLIFEQNKKIMSDAVDLQVLLDQVLAKQAEQKASLDAIKSGIGTIVANIPAGGMTAAEVTALKAKAQAVLDGENVNATEAADDAAAVAAAQPAAPPAV